MAAKDVDMARQLVTDLNALTFSNGATATYSRDVDVAKHEVTTPKLWVDATLSHNRVDRQSWSTAVTIQVTAVARKIKSGSPGSADVESEKDAWLAFIDNELIAAIQAAKLLGKKPASITFTDRLQADALRNDHKLFTQFQIQFPHV